MLKGIRGLSEFQLKQIDVSKIVSIDSRKRLFKILDQDYDYTLDIVYNKSITKSKLMPVGPIFVPMSYTETEHNMTRRYKTKKDVDDEINEIKMKQNEINKTK